MSTGENSNPMNIEQIEQRLPHRYPFLLLDRILELVPGQVEGKCVLCLLEEARPHPVKMTPVKP